MYVDLFAGCGGLSLGLYNAGLKGLFAVEKNEDAFATLKKNLIQERNHFSWPNWLDMECMDIDTLLKDYRTQLIELRDEIDLVVGGPPCQGFSMAGKRKKGDARNRLYNAYVDFIELVQPRKLFFENVHGFTIGFKNEGQKKRGEPYSAKLVRKLSKMGYDVACDEITMSEYGVPQKRVRFILFAIKGGAANDFFVKLKENRDSFMQQKHLDGTISVFDAISDLERQHGEVPSAEMPRFSNGIYGMSCSSYQDLMRYNTDTDFVPDSHRFANQKRETVELLKKLMQVSNGVICISPQMNMVEGLKKRGVTPLKRNCVCPTITSIPDDFVHYSEPRIMTVREFARIQSFPDDFVFCGQFTTGGKKRRQDVPRYTQVANAVPPLFAEQVGIALRDM